MNNKNNQFCGKEFIFNILILIYIIILIKLILFKDIPLLSITKIFSEGFEGFWDFNLIPFSAAVNMIGNRSVGIIRLAANVIANILLFIPLGIIIKTKYGKLPLLKLVVITGVVSLFFEIAQFFLKIGISDIDDIILNSLGGFLGGLLIKIAQKRKMNISPNLLILIMIVFMLGSLFFYNRIGFVNENISIINENEHLLSDLKEGTEDYFGKVVSIQKDEIEIELELPRADANFVGETILKKVNIKDITNIVLGTITIKKAESGYDEIHTFYQLITTNEINELLKEHESLSVRVWNERNLNKDNGTIDAGQILITIRE